MHVLIPHAYHAEGVAMCAGRGAMRAEDAASTRSARSSGDPAVQAAASRLPPASPLRSTAAAAATPRRTKE
jgi:hypothetical protein